MSNSNTPDVVDTPQEVFNLLPFWARQVIYVVVVLVGVASAVYLSVLGYLDVSAPSWYGAATAGWVTLTGAFGLVAASNTSKQVVDTTGTVISETPESAGSALPSTSIPAAQVELPDADSALRAAAAQASVVPAEG
ncbi:MAG: hypothetical protein LKI98_03340 [Bifidobacterium crudilactis]|jgi:hypothetical protein|nr:hypothetical protein [Bifidobacterium crudilactis]MCI1889455.1 hypothetical protein [Bifidobacterium crudilactis]